MKWTIESCYQEVIALLHLKDKSQLRDEYTQHIDEEINDLMDIYVTLED